MMVVLLGVFKHGLIITVFMFVMLSQFLCTAPALFFGMLLMSGIVLAWISDRIIPILGITPCESCINAYCEECLSGIDNQESIRGIFRPANFVENFQSPSFTRFFLFIFSVFFMVLVILGTLGTSAWDWKCITFISLSMCTLCIIMVYSEHYLEFHIWGYIIKKHLFRVFLWSFGALL